MPAFARFLAAVPLLAAPAAQAADPVPVTRAELQALASDKTHKDYRGGRWVRTIYFTADGHFTMLATGKNPVWITGNWTIQESSSGTAYLCTEAKLGNPCSTFTAGSGGKFVKEGGYVVEVSDGDPEHVAEKVAQINADAAARSAARAAPPPGDYLTAEEIRALVSGKTTIERRLDQRRGQDDPSYFYHQADGTAYFMHGEGGWMTTWRGPWRIDGNRLCMDSSSWRCVGFRRAAAGRVLKEYGQGDAGTRSLEAVDGDPHNVAAIVSNTPPYNQPTTARGTSPAQPSRPSFLDNTTVR